MDISHGAPCALCGHTPSCGYAQVDDHWLCHGDDHVSCYQLWTWGARPSPDDVVVRGLEARGVLAEADAFFDALERGEPIERRPADEVIAEARARIKRR